MADQGASFSRILIAFIFVSLFAVLLISWGLSTSTNYSAISGKEQGQNSEYVKTMLQYEQINSSLSSTQSDAQSWSDKFQNQNIFSIIGGIVVNGIFDITKLMWTAVTVPFGIFGNIMQGVFGIPPIVTGVFTAVLMITMLFAIWRLIKIGY
jgi:hypothetical protein